MLNEVQKLNFELMKKATFNSFDGEKVVKALEEHQDLWVGAVMDRASYCMHKSDESPVSEKIDLIKLRDISDGYWNIDTLFIVPQVGQEDQLEMLAKTWEADEVDWMSNPDLGTSRPPRVLRVWWD